MNAIEKKLQAMNTEYQKQLAIVREEYNSLNLTNQLMQRHNMPNAQDAINEEARQRCLRNKWAQVTR